MLYLPVGQINTKTMLNLQTSIFRLASYVKKLKQFSVGFIEADSMEKLSYNIHLLVAVLLLLQTFFVTIFRYSNYPFAIVLINLSEISVYLLSLILYWRKQYAASVFTTAFLIPVIFSWVLFSFERISFESCLWFLLAFEFIYIIIIRKNINRIIYVAFCAAIFFIPGVISYYNHPSARIIKFVQLATLTAIPMIIASFIEYQDRRVKNLNRELKRKYIEKKTDAHRLDKKNNELVVFSHIMSHDLKSPLSTIKAFTGLLVKDIKKEEDNERQIKYLNFILSSADSMTVLINDLLAYSKIETDNYSLEDTDLQNVVEEVLPSFQFDIMDRQVDIEIKKLPIIQGNPNVIKTVFHNLISNSIKYQPKNTANHHPKIVIWSEENEEQYNVFIQDNGIDFKKEHIDDLFTPFKRFHSNKEYKGTGLGMSICRRIMEKHKGSISLQSTSEEGSVFRLTFPKSA